MPDRFQELIHFVPPPTAATESTRAEALRTAAKFATPRYLQILRILHDSPRCIFEVADLLSSRHHRAVPESFARTDTIVHPHQISGRFTELEDAGLISKSDARRPTPTGCSAAVYQLTLAGQAVLQEANMAPSNHVQRSPA